MKVVSTTLKLACCPLAFRDIAWAKSDVDYRKSLGKARVYMVAKKPHVDFCNVKFSGHKIDFDLVSECGRVSISIPANEPLFKPSEKKTLVVDVGAGEPHVLAKDEIVAKTHGIKFYEVDTAFFEKASDKELKKCLDEDSFVAWLTPERLLYLYSNRLIRIPNLDKTKCFLWNYEPMFIGKVVRPIVKNTETRHARETILDMLESEIEDCEDICNDVVFLFFDVEERDNSLLIGNAVSINEFQLPLNGLALPSIDLLAVAAENVFTEKFKPKYNAALFHPYLNGEDVATETEYDAIDYAVDDWMTLVFKGMKWYGGLEGNCLVYSKGDGLRVMRPTDFDDFLERKFIESVLACS
jgi:hypothetical protein